MELAEELVDLTVAGIGSDQSVILQLATPVFLESLLLGILQDQHLELVQEIQEFFLRLLHEVLGFILVALFNCIGIKAKQLGAIVVELSVPAEAAQNVLLPPCGLRWWTRCLAMANPAVTLIS